MQLKAVEAAIKEVLTPTLGITEQILSVHQIVMRSATPVIARIQDKSESGAYHIYFALEGEPYYFVVAVSFSDNQYFVSGSYIESAVRVYLRVSSDILEPEEITSRVGLIPTQCYTKGEKRYQRNPHLKFKEHRWYFELDKDIPNSIEEKLDSLLEKLEPVKTQVASLSDECEILICICYEGYKSWMGGWHFNRSTILKIASLKAEVNLDLYAFGPDLPE